MKKKIGKIIIYSICFVLVIAFINNCLLKCNEHIFEYNNEKCIKCLILYMNKEILKNILTMVCILILFINIRFRYKLLEILPKSFYTNLVSMKVRLNE